MPFVVDFLRYDGVGEDDDEGGDRQHGQHATNPMRDDVLPLPCLEELDYLLSVQRAQRPTEAPEGVEGQSENPFVEAAIQ